MITVHRHAAEADAHTGDLGEEAAKISSRREKTKTKLLAAANEVFAEHGIGASVEQISEAAGFSRGAFYSNFSSKEELLRAVLEQEQEIALATLAETGAGILDEAAATDIDEAGHDQLVARVVAGFLALYGDDKRSYMIRSEFALNALRDDKLAAIFNAHQEEFFAALAQVIVDLLERIGRRFTIDPVSAAMIACSAYETSLRQSFFSGGTEARHEQFSNEVLPALVRGLTEKYR